MEAKRGDILQESKEERRALAPVRKKAARAGRKRLSLAALRIHI